MRTTRAFLTLYVAIVVAGGVMALVLAHANSERPLLGAAPLPAVLLAALALLAELQPLRWLSRGQGSDITGSWTFVFALLYLAPPATGLSVAVAAGLLSELVSRRPLTKACFNAGQVAIALGLGYLVLATLSEPLQIVEKGEPDLPWLLAAGLGAALAFTVNGVLLSVVVALYQRLHVRSILRRSLGVNLTLDGFLIALSPVFALVAVHAPLLMPLLLVTIWAIFKSAELSLRHRYEATHDLLTGLPNRRFFFDQTALALERAGRDGGTLGFLHIDLDGFKGINDRLGHHVGDLVLVEVAGRLRADRDAADVIARLGGDEFVIMLGSVADATDAQTRAVEVLERIRAPFDVEGVPIAIDASVGQAVFPEHGDDIDTLLARADLAMYEAKTHQLGLQLYEGFEHDRGPTRLGLLGELPRAVERSELFVVYQPKVSLVTGRISGVEALIRWRHPERGVLLPGLFMPAAEQTELMHPITAAVLEQAIAQAARWQAEGLVINVAVNASARNVHHLGFPRLVHGILQSHGVAGSRLEVELTENTVMSDPRRTAAVLDQLRTLGVTVSIDDFGTGFSSLANLRVLPVDKIKIDRSFVSSIGTNAQDALIVRSLVDLARNLGLSTVAEGVESEATRQLLADWGCAEAQGYAISPPVDAAAIAALARRLEALDLTGGDR